MNSILKLIEYLRKVSKEPLEVDGKVQPTPSKVIIHPSIFMKDDCKMCGICCSSEFNTVYSESGVNFIKSAKNIHGVSDFEETKSKLLSTLITSEHTVNGKKCYYLGVTNFKR